MTPAQQSALSALAVASETLTATAAAVAEAERVLRASLVPVEPPAPAPEPPPPPPATGAIVFSEISAGTVPIPGGAGRRCVVALHGGGESNLTRLQGTVFKGVRSGSFLPQYTGHTDCFFEARSDSTGMAVALMPQNHNLTRSGVNVRDFWVGHIDGPNTALDMASVRWVGELVRQAPTLFPQIDPDKICLSGNSMGAWGAAKMLQRLSDRLAYASLDMPIWRRFGTTSDVFEVCNLKVSPINQAQPFSGALQLSTVDGGGPASVYFDMIAYAANPANALCPVVWNVTTEDGYGNWQDHILMVQAMRATKRWFRFAWGPGSHGFRPPYPADLVRGQDLDQFVRGRGLPLFTACSRDADPASAPSGAINPGMCFANVVETPTTWTCSIRNVLPGDTTVTVEPCMSKVFNPQGLPVAPQTHVLTQNVWKTVTFTVPAPPPPAPPPPAPPPPRSFAKVIPLDPSRLVGFETQQATGGFSFAEAYDRKEDLVLTTGAPLALRLFSGRMVSPIGPTPFVSAALDVIVHRFNVDGTTAEVSRTAVDPPDGAKSAAFTLPVDGLSHGWHMLTAAGPGGESCIPLLFMVDRGHGNPPMMPVIPTTYDLYSRKWSECALAWVPARDDPVTQPLTPRNAVPFTSRPTRKTIFERQIVPWDHASSYLPGKTASGIVHAFRDQWYYWDTLTGAKYPPLPLLDGPRGRATLGMATHITIGRTADYVLTPWSLCKVDRTGHVTTLLGYGHAELPPDFDRTSTPAQMRAAATKYGDFAEDLLFHDGWGHCFLSTTTGQGSGQPIPNDGLDGTLESPHDAPVLGLIAGGSTGNLVQTESDPRSHATPMKARVLRRMADPWDVINIPGTDLCVVSERQAHRLVVVNGRTGEEVETLLGNPNGDSFAYMAQNRVFRLRQPLDAVREQAIVLPEGMAWHDGWVYWGSAAMGQIRRIHWTTREQQIVVANGHMSGGVNFYKIAVDTDGGFLPAGSILLSTWSIANRGRPIAYLPDGTSYAYASLNASAEGPGLPFKTIDYSSACAVKGGRMVHSSSGQGLWEITQAQPSDAVVREADYDRAVAAYRSRWLDMTHGEGGWGRFGLPLPWGLNPDVDAYLSFYGHSRSN